MHTDLMDENDVIPEGTEGLYELLCAYHAAPTSRNEKRLLRELCTGAAMLNVHTHRSVTWCRETFVQEDLKHMELSEDAPALNITQVHVVRRPRQLVDDYMNHGIFTSIVPAALFMRVCLEGTVKAIFLEWGYPYVTILFRNKVGADTPFSIIDPRIWAQLGQPELLKGNTSHITRTERIGKMKKLRSTR
ncbi:MAG: hypothetical protein ACOH13_06380 [Flavobacteriales bacterium]